MFVDYVENGQAFGPIANTMSGFQYDPGWLRPYIETNPTSPRRGRPCVTILTGRMLYNSQTQQYVPERRSVLISDLQARGRNSPVFNTTTLRKEEWIELDRKVVRAARYRLKAWADLAAANAYGGFNGMSKLILEHETMSDPGEAIVDMDGLTEGRNDMPLFQLQGLPLPITHSDFFMSARKLAISRNTSTPLDSTLGEASGRRVAEMIEKTTIGVNTGITYGGNSTYVGGYGRNSSVYGYINFPQRLTKTNITAPTAGGWTAATTLNDVLACIDQLKLNKFYGPYMLYTSNDWDKYMDGDYILTGGNVATQTLRERLKKIEDIVDVKRLDFLFGSQPSASTGPGTVNDVAAKAFQLVFVQMTSEVAQAVNGMDLTVVQWETKGGMQLNFKVMAIQVPRIRADYYGNCGVLQATTS